MPLNIYTSADDQTGGKGKMTVATLLDKIEAEMEAEIACASTSGSYFSTYWHAEARNAFGRLHQILVNCAPSTLTALVIFHLASPHDGLTADVGAGGDDALNPAMTKRAESMPDDADNGWGPDPLPSSSQDDESDGWGDNPFWGDRWPVSHSSTVTSKPATPATIIVGTADETSQDHRDGKSGMGNLYPLCPRIGSSQKDPGETFKEALKRELRHELETDILPELKEELRAEIWACVQADLPNRDEQFTSALSKHESSTRKQLEAFGRRVDKVDTLVRAEVAEELVPIRLSIEERLEDAIADVNDAGKRQRAMCDAAVKAAEGRLEASTENGRELNQKLLETCAAMEKMSAEVQTGSQLLRKDQEEARELMNRAQAEAAAMQTRLEATIDLVKASAADSSQLMLATAGSIAQQVNELLQQSKQYAQQASLDILQQRAAAVDAVAFHVRAHTGYTAPFRPAPTSGFSPFSTPSYCSGTSSFSWESGDTSPLAARDEARMQPDHSEGQEPRDIPAAAAAPATLSPWLYNYSRPDRNEGLL